MGAWMRKWLSWRNSSRRRTRTSRGCRACLADAEAKAASVESEVAELRRQLEALRSEQTKREAESETLRIALDEATTAARVGAERYREVVLTAAPELPAELVGGETIAAVDESLSRAPQTVAQVRQHLEQQAQAQRVPAGAPIRAAPDLSDLSATEKIRLGLQIA